MTVPLPDDATPVTVTELFLDTFGTPETGTVIFTPSAVVAVGSATLTMDPVTARVVAGVLLAPNGTSPLVLAATDDVDQQPTGWTYRVEIKVGSRVRPTYYVQLPSDPSSRVLHTLSPIATSPITGRPLVRSVNGVFPDAAGNIEVSGGGGGGVPTTRTISTAGLLTGGGDLSANRTITSPGYGTGAGTITQGNDVRLSDARTPLAHVHAESDVTNLVTDLAGKAGKAALRSVVKIDGNIQLSTGTNTWGPLTGAPVLAVPAVVGDCVEVDVTALRQANANILLDWGVLVGGGIVRYAATNSATPGGEGNPGLYHTALPAAAGTWKFVAGSGDISGGNVTVTFAIRNLSGASSLLLASTDNPLTVTVENTGPKS